MLIDSHAHLDSERYTDDREAMLRRAWEAGVGTVLSIGIGEQASGMDQALQVCRQFNSHPESGSGLPRLYASAGARRHYQSVAPGIGADSRRADRARL